MLRQRRRFRISALKLESSRRFQKDRQNKEGKVSIPQGPSSSGGDGQGESGRRGLLPLHTRQMGVPCLETREVPPTPPQTTLRPEST